MTRGKTQLRKEGLRRKEMRGQEVGNDRNGGLRNILNAKVGAWVARLDFWRVASIISSYNLGRAAGCTGSEFNKHPIKFAAKLPIGRPVHPVVNYGTGNHSRIRIASSSESSRSGLQYSSSRGSIVDSRGKICSIIPFRLS